MAPEWRSPQSLLKPLLSPLFVLLLHPSGRMRRSGRILPLKGTPKQTFTIPLTSMQPVSPTPHTPRIGLILTHGFAIIAPADILWAEEADRGSRIHLVTEEILEAVLSLSELTKKLPPFKFCRISAGCLVSLQYVLDQDDHPESCLYLQGGIRLPLAEALTEATRRRITAAIERNRIL